MITRLVALPIAVLFAAATYGAEPPVGFVCHYPWIDVGMDELPRSGASALITRAVFGMEPSEGVFDFSSLDRQIAYAEKHNLKLVLLLECNPVYSPPWLTEKVKAAGEMQKTMDGADHTIPSIHSPVFRKAQEEFVRRVIAHVKERDTSRVITHYQPGAEWWFEQVGRYNSLDIARFREWLRKRYVNVKALNTAWGSAYTSFTEVPAPRLGFADAGPTGGLNRVLDCTGKPQDCSWSTHPSEAPEVIPGKEYVFSAWVKAESVAGRGVHLSAAWLPKDSGVPFRTDYSENLVGTTGWRKLSMRVRAPERADRVWLLLKLAGFGTVSFDDADFREVGGTRNLLQNGSLDIGSDTPEKWFFDNWLQGEGVRGEYVRSGGRSGACVRISVPHPAVSERTFRNVDAASHDWWTFWYESGAEYINDLARMVKRLDPSRQTATYLTYSFAFPAEWDYSQSVAISPDVVAMRGKDVDVIGMQICSADGDPYRVIACLDVVRKYGMPMWAVDLLDFTSGVAVGYPAMDKVTQSAVQHGADGIFYYCWNGTPDYNFYPDMPMEDLNRMLSGARTTIRLVEGMQIRPRGALVEPILPASPSDPHGFKNDYRSFIGWYKILQAMHWTFDIVTLTEIAEGAANLSEYEWILVPDCAYLSDTARSRLERYASGGLLITSGRSGVRCPNHLPDYGRAYAGNLIRDTHAGNTPPLFLWRNDTPATRKTFGLAKAQLSKLLEASGIRNDVEISPDSPEITCAVFAQGNRRAIFLVNMGRLPASEVTLRIPGAAPEVDVYVDAKRTDCSVRSGDKVEVALPAFRTSAIVRYQVADKN